MINFIRIGCSGWSYESWEGIFYPKEEGNKLSFYSKIFNTVEVDSTFYSFPENSLVINWLKNTPDNFIFSLKIPNVITHEKKLSIDSIKDLKKFLEIISPLKQKLGILLIQLPPFFKKDKYRARFETFLSFLDTNYKWAVEFRESSWFENSIFKILSKYNIAFTIVDAPSLPNNIITTADFSLIRFHGKGKSIWYNYLYSEEEIKEWKEKITKINCKELYVYFNNHYKAFAALNALQLSKELGLTNSEQNNTLEKIKLVLSNELKSLLSFAEKGNLIQEFRNFTTDQRFERGINIKSNEIQIREIEEEKWCGWVSGYFIEINFKEKIIKHECQDWIKNIEENKFLLCKHIIAFIKELTMDQQKRFLESLKEGLKAEGRISL